MEKEQLEALSHFLNQQPNLPLNIQAIADELKESLSPVKKVLKKK